MRTAGQGPGGFEKRDGFMKPGQDLVMAGYTGFAGTRRIGVCKRGELEAHFPPMFLRSLYEAEGISVKQWMEREAVQGGYPVTAWEYAGEGGVLAALWNLSGIYKAGVDVDLRLFPIRQVTVEVCELYGLNPYRLLCGECAILAADQGGQLVRRLGEDKIPAAVVGCVTQGITRQVRHGGETAACLERPQPDELLKIIDKR